MWRLKTFLSKNNKLEGKTLTVGSTRVQVRSVIAEGGFSIVYLAKDCCSDRNYALKYTSCSTSEILQVVMKEIDVMLLLKGHPNILTLHDFTVMDSSTKQGKECFLLLDYCEETLSKSMNRREGRHLPEEILLNIFRDICNGLAAMHGRVPAIAHRDLKVENILRHTDGQWIICDFGSVSTVHKRFCSADEIGVEEDMIRKYTTPAYRAPEMWDLYSKEVISEKADIWALGCLLYQLAYLKLPFTGESKLQVLNCNYEVPDMPRYSPVVPKLINSMLQLLPSDRPSIIEVLEKTKGALAYAKNLPSHRDQTGLKGGESTGLFSGRQPLDRSPQGIAGGIGNASVDNGHQQPPRWMSRPTLSGKTILNDEIFKEPASSGSSKFALPTGNMCPRGSFWVHFPTESQLQKEASDKS